MPQVKPDLEVFAKIKVTGEGECGDVFRGKAAHFIELQFSEQEVPAAPETAVSPEMRARRDLYTALSKVYRFAIDLRKEVKAGGPVYSKHVTEFVAALGEAGKIKSLPVHNNEPKKEKREKKEKVAK